MTTKKWVLIIMFGLLLCLIVLRETGIVDVSLYKSKLSSSHSITKSTVNPGGQEPFSYHVTLKHDDTILEDFSHSWNNQPTIEVEAVLDKCVYSGNTALPLIKHFTMTYRCTFSTTESPGGYEVEGTITGKVEAIIHGYCSRKKAKKLAFEEAKKQIASYLHELHKK